jgi:hypothetical protein
VGIVVDQTNARAHSSFFFYSDFCEAKGKSPSKFAKFNFDGICKKEVCQVATGSNLL